jgi:hypothetical protein
VLHSRGPRLAVGPPGTPVKHVKADDEEFGEAMKKWTFRSLAAAALGVIALAGQANAAVSYSYVTDQANYNVAPGTTQTIRLYLRETLGNGDASVITGDGGLGGFGVQVNRAAAGSAKITGYDFNGAEFGAYPSAVSRPGVTDSNAKMSAGTFSPVFPGNTGGTFTDTSFAPPVIGKSVTSPSVPNQVFLGNVYIALDAAAAPGATTTFTALPYSTTSGGNTLTFNNQLDLDFNNTQAPVFTGAVNFPTNFTVTAVPEPTSAALLVLGGLGSLIRRRRSVA